MRNDQHERLQSHSHGRNHTTCDSRQQESHHYINVVGNESIAIGNSTVSFAEGLLVVKHTTPQQVELPLGEGIWEICDTGKTDDVRILMPDGD